MSNPESEISDKLTVLSREPLVAGAALASFNGGVVPADEFFVRNHFPIPRPDTSSWTLTVSGEVKTPLSLGYDEMKRLPSKEIEVLLECAGNSRQAIQPSIEGLLWDHGGVSTARWFGVPLRNLLDQAGVLGSAREVLLEGADRGEERGEPGEIGFSMSLPMDKALDPDTLLAWEMNGELLAAEHGFPLRAVVPGWYGMTSVKWLSSIRVLDRPFQGFHQTRYYVFVEEGVENGLPKERVTSMKVKSFITSPSRGQILSVGRHDIRGVAWSGQTPVSRVEISTDDGHSWQPAFLEESESPRSWCRWAFVWEAHRPGYYLLRARATDQEGNIQPAKARWNFRGFANNSIHTVPVQVRAALPP